jgi:hypothetical protein
MMGFGEDNNEFGKLPPYLTVCQEVISDEESASRIAYLAS